ncbi:hypothetical protein FA95DRAFT_1576241 [Auriscalpium vulgare]|uniref:Uncharacterized protein n=1 Tax=Auriscalpium vulgare TaxID=40419 RepID=A0ACB8RC04_9AGAM|nr:hypothetical protein FA95DRAFT_1576241 [Auriscalpium vulgare]
MSLSGVKLPSSLLQRVCTLLAAALAEGNPDLFNMVEAYKSTIRWPSEGQDFLFVRHALDTSNKVGADTIRLSFEIGDTRGHWPDTKVWVEEVMPTDLRGQTPGIIRALIKGLTEVASKGDYFLMVQIPIETGPIYGAGIGATCKSRTPVYGCHLGRARVKRRERTPCSINQIRWSTARLPQLMSPKSDTPGAPFRARPKALKKAGRRDPYRNIRAAPLTPAPAPSMSARPDGPTSTPIDIAILPIANMFLNMGPAGQRIGTEAWGRKFVQLWHQLSPANQRHAAAQSYLLCARRAYELNQTQEMVEWGRGILMPDYVSFQLIRRVVDRLDTPAVSPAVPSFLGHVGNPNFVYQTDGETGARELLDVIRSAQQSVQGVPNLVHRLGLNAMQAETLTFLRQTHARKASEAFVLEAVRGFADALAKDGVTLAQTYGVQTGDIIAGVFGSAAQEASRLMVETKCMDAGRATYQSHNTSSGALHSAMAKAISSWGPAPLGDIRGGGRYLGEIFGGDIRGRYSGEIFGGDIRGRYSGEIFGDCQPPPAPDVPTGTTVDASWFKIVSDKTSPPPHYNVAYHGTIGPDSRVCSPGDIWVKSAGSKGVWVSQGQGVWMPWELVHGKRDTLRHLRCAHGSGDVEHPLAIRADTYLSYSSPKGWTYVKKGTLYSNSVKLTRLYHSTCNPVEQTIMPTTEFVIDMWLVDRRNKDNGIGSNVPKKRMRGETLPPAHTSQSVRSVLTSEQLGRLSPVNWPTSPTDTLAFDYANDWCIGPGRGQWPSDAQHIIWPDKCKTVLPFMGKVVSSAVDIDMDAVMKMAKAPLATDVDSPVVIVDWEITSRAPIEAIVRSALARNQTVVVNNAFGDQGTAHELIFDESTIASLVGSDRVKLEVHCMRKRLLEPNDNPTVQLTLGEFWHKIRDPNECVNLLDLPRSYGPRPTFLGDVQDDLWAWNVTRRVGFAEPGLQFAAAARKKKNVTALVEAWVRRSEDPVPDDIGPVMRAADDYEGWHIVSSAGVYTRTHHDSNGLATWAAPRCGMKFWGVVTIRNRIAYSKEDQIIHLYDYS